MRSITSCILYVCVSLIINAVSAQTVNWANLEKGHVVNANVGAAYGVVYGAGYAYKTGGHFPVMAQVNISVPSGNQLFDDFSARYGIEMSAFQWNNLRGVAAVRGIYRRFQNDLVTAKNFGAEMSVAIGVYKPRWFAAAEAGFDKAIITNFRHSDAYREEFPLVKDGWYHPPTGGNFNYGLRTGISFKSSDVTIRLGSIMAEDFKSRPMLPFYAQLGYNYRLPCRVKH